MKQLDRISVVFLATIISTSSIVGCSEEPAPLKVRARTVKALVVGEHDDLRERRFPGTIEPADSSRLSFEVGGVIQAMNVSVGDRVEEGQVLARLDQGPFRLQVESAKAGLARAKADFDEKRTAYDRQLRIVNEDAGATSEQAVEEAKAAFEAGKQDTSYSQAQLDLALRDLDKTRLVAPYDGVVSERYFDTFEEVRGGEAVIDVFSEGAMEILVQVPEDVIGRTRAGQRGRVRLSREGDKYHDAVVSEVGSTAIAANSFPVRAVLEGSDAGIRPGMSAELVLDYGDSDAQAGFLLPIHAIVDGEQADARYVFLVKDGVVRKTQIPVGSGAEGNRVRVSGGIAVGDVVVVAGAKFLRDGEPVRVLETTVGND